ncbi:hypothetical protein [Streptomyces sp. NPDC051561]|uniref:hypothetical protein n=1 Tax=Streptomyces sp. NPDC051561 TaxID=3365658 RepID=UPI0037934C3C
MKISKRTRAVGVLATAFALTFGFSGSAMAADHTMNTGDAWGAFGYSGKGEFTEYGDIVKICDIDADGYAVHMRVALDDAYGSLLYNTWVGGEGNCITHRASEGGKLNLPEGKYIGFQFCRYKAEKTSECKNYRFLNDN